MPSEEVFSIKAAQHAEDLQGIGSWMGPQGRPLSQSPNEGISQVIPKNQNQSFQGLHDSRYSGICSFVKTLKLIFSALALRPRAFNTGYPSLHVNNHGAQPRSFTF